MQWLEPFRIEIDDVRPLICAFATSTDDEPSVRSVVCREVEDDGTLLICSDSRSGKRQELRQTTPLAEVCFWLEKKRVQWRITGSVKIEKRTDRALKVWHELSPSARALFFWPRPAEPRSASDEFPREIGPDAKPHSNFDLLALSPTRVDRLDLNPHPHRRTIWEGPKWSVGVDVNP